MTTLFESMSTGWHQYADGGMYLGLFFGSMVFLWLVCRGGFTQSGHTGKKKLFLYAVGITALILCPLSAFFLLKYQTAFFTYSHLFLMIPVTLVVAWAMTELLDWAGTSWIKEKEVPEFFKKKPWAAELCMVCVLAFVLWMAGTLSFARESTGETVNGAKIPGEVLQVLETLQTDEDIDLEQDTLVATDEVLEYARAYSADFKLLYGRNMWQKELNAYTYDTYSEELESLHQWLMPTAYSMLAVNDNITAKEAVKILESSECTVLVMKQVQFEDEKVKAALEDSLFEPVAETDVYVILKK
ncbi:MAG: hypothetical protein IJ282_05015 [Lachnospiraceae bacterium]|nr:hypothetical protein [Lachnospiraceae bacterium]